MLTLTDTIQVTNMENTGEVIRRAQLSDYDQVMDMSTSVHGGIDYLPVTYTKFFEDPQILSFVTENHGQVVAFISMIYLPRDKTVVSVAKRVHPAHRKKGLATRLVEEALAVAKGTWPDVRLHTWSSVYLPVYDKMRDDPANRLRHTQIWTSFACINPYKKTQQSIHLFTKNQKAKGHHEEEEEIIVQSLEPEALLSILANSDAGKLFPGGYLGVLPYWIPKAAKWHNLQTTFSTHHVLCTLDESNTKCVSLSLGVALRKGESLCVCSVYYYSTQKSCTYCTAHVKEQVMRMLNEERNVCLNVSLRLLIISEVSVDGELEQIKSMLGGDVKVLWETHKIYLEQDIM